MEGPPGYGELRIDLVVETIQRLERRISERFPGSGLAQVSVRLGRIAAATEAEVRHLQEPLWLPRIGTALGIAGMLGIAVFLIIVLPASTQANNIFEFFQGSEAAVNLAVLLSIGIYGTVTFETRYKRRTVLQALYRLRSVIHVVDMHQLTKDPEAVLSPKMATASSPERPLTRFELVRYLDYCSELLSLTSKVAALYVQHLNDAVVLAAVNDIESLAASLSHKIWQKIMIIGTAAKPEA
jgi:hypothetical protein